MKSAYGDTSPGYGGASSFQYGDDQSGMYNYVDTRTEAGRRKMETLNTIARAKAFIQKKQIDD